MHPFRLGFSKKKPKNILFLASGRGSNFEAVASFLNKNPSFGTGIGLFSDNPKAGALEIAKKFQIPTQTFPFASYPVKKDYHREILDAVLKKNPDLIVACGYMRILNSDFVNAFPGKILNVHPSLLPSFPGLSAQKQALDYGAKVTGCTIHFVEEGVDTGPIVLQKAIEISDDMTEKELSVRILKEEHKLLCLAVQYFCEDKLTITGRKVLIKK